jgi:hypothetical protein
MHVHQTHVVRLIALTPLTSVPHFLIYAISLSLLLVYLHLLNSLFLMEYNFFIYTFLIYAHFSGCRTRPWCILCMYSYLLTF